MRKAFLSTTPSLGLLSKENEDKVITCITNLFKAVSMYFDSPLSQEKAEVIAAELLSKYEYRSLKLEDLVVICKEIKEGDVFKITPARILRQVKKYSDDRQKLAIAINRELSESSKTALNNQLQERLNDHFKSTANVDKLASRRNQIESRFK
ncbi:conserved hypothetical protein [Tenacibaculum aestuarii]